MKRVRGLVGASFVLGFVSAVALFAEYLALCDITKVSTPVTEWYVVGVCMIVTVALVISTLITLGFVIAQPQFSPEVRASRAE
jgi:type III secretory pathway component EscU